MKAICKFNDPFNLPLGVPNNFNFGLEVNKEYLVMGISLFDNFIYYLVDENGRPNWFPCEIFEITESRLNPNWHFNFLTASETQPSSAIWGFYELCFTDKFYDLLIERDESTMIIYFKRKIEMEKIFQSESMNVIDSVISDITR